MKYSVEEINCYDCDLWKKGTPDGTCAHYVNNNCPYGFSEKTIEN